MQIPVRPTSLDDFLREASVALEGQGWRVVLRRDLTESPWHLICRKVDKWRVVQVLTPAVSHQVTENARRSLGRNVQLPARLGTMEQWVAHVRPDNRCTFGPYILNPQIWGSDEEVLTKLGVDET